MSKRSLLADHRNRPVPWRIWNIILLLVNFVAPFFFIGHIEAQLTLAAFVVASIVVVGLHRRLGWVRLLGVGHFAWFALLPWMFTRYVGGDPQGAFRLWMQSLLVVDTLCLVIDLTDLARYAAGDREPLVPAG